MLRGPTLEHGLARLREGFPLSNRLIRGIHAVLLSRGRGSDKEPGEFRRSQNWIGGSRPGNAVFVPPPHTEVPDAMGGVQPRFPPARAHFRPTRYTLPTPLVLSDVLRSIDV